MDHATFLERHHELTNAGLAEAHLLLARGDASGAADALEALSEALQGLAGQDEGGEVLGAHAEYLEAHKIAAEAAVVVASSALSEEDAAEAARGLGAARSMLDALWSARVDRAQREVRP